MSAVFFIKDMQIRGNQYHYRRRVPADLVEFFGRKEVTRSLHTDKPQDAVRLKNKIDGLVEQLFQACRFEALTAEAAQARLNAILHGGPPPVVPEDQPSKIVIIAPPTRRRGKRLSDAVDAYCKEKEHSWTAKTRKEFAGLFDRLTKGLSDPWLQDLDRPTLVEFRDVLSREGKHARTVNKYLQVLSSVLRHASRLKWIQGNPAEGLSLQDSRREDEIRRAFSPEEIRAIFNALQRDKKGFYAANHPERYWLPLLGLYTGARVNELAQLELKDVVVDDGIPAILITAVGGEDKRLKNESSRRILPLHADLLTLGFLVYVAKLRGQGQTRLFPSLRLGPNGFSHYFVAQHFSGDTGWLRRNIPSLENGMAFHCFRHSFATMLKNAEQPERLIEELMGHKSTSMSLGRYGKPYKTDIRAKAINVIKYGILPCPTRIEDSYYDDDREETINATFLVCGNTSVEIDPDERIDPLELRQYQRPDLHGYSPFHSEIHSFMPESQD